MGLPTSVNIVKNPSQVCLEAHLLGDSEFYVELTAGAEDLCVSPPSSEVTGVHSQAQLCRGCWGSELRL